MIKWEELTSLEQLEKMIEESDDKTILLFKHSTRCSTSRLMLDRLQRSWEQEEMASVAPYFLDLITYRDVSNAIAQYFQIGHESPQVILINGRKAIYDGAHYEIEYKQLKKLIQN
jgi:bacillithiol system protein YtxJ